MLREIQRTGDIFFPKRWTDTTLGGHSSASAAPNGEADFCTRAARNIPIGCGVSCCRRQTISRARATCPSSRIVEQVIRAGPQDRADRRRV